VGEDELLRVAAAGVVGTDRPLAVAIAARRSEFRGRN